ncbi:MAG: LOG family protein [Anaerolineae bacterium]|nr:LOG family protein [Anaerolineae bacterium]
MHTVTVFGSAQPLPGAARYEEARLLGRLLAQAGCRVANGGYSGTMEAVSRGAVEAGGAALGVTCAAFDGARSGGNPYLTDAIHAPDLLARLRLLIERGDGYVVLDGGIGTLLELFLVWNLLAIGVAARPCILVGPHWRRVLADLERETQVEPRHVAMLHVVDTVGEAANLLEQLLAE